MISPSSNSPIIPPLYASGVMCPTTNPCVPPENLPSVIKATSFPNPAPISSPVGLSISGIPGAPLGPDCLITITDPASIFLACIAAFVSSSDSNTCAGPEKINPSLPVIFATAPSNAKFPNSICKWPCSLMASLTG